MSFNLIPAIFTGSFQKDADEKTEDPVCQITCDADGEDADDDPDWDQDEDPDGENADGEEEDEPAGSDDEPTMGTTVVRIGHLHFKVEVPRYKRLVESIRDAGIFDQGEIAQEMKRRLLRHD